MNDRNDFENSPRKFDYERRTDSLLRAVERKRQVEIAQTRSSRLKSLKGFKVGDPITISLIGVSIDGIPIESDGIIQGSIINPEYGLISVRHNTTELDEITGTQIGLAVDHTATSPTGEEITVTHRGQVAGNNGFAYFRAEDTVTDMAGEQYALPDNINHPALTYGRIAVVGTVLFDFITAPENL